MHPTRHRIFQLGWSILLGSIATTSIASTASDRIASPGPGDVRFSKAILPILQRNCLACHNQSQAKAGLSLETPGAILRGGDTGPGIIPGDSGRSLVYNAAAHRLPDLIMPPRGNKARAVDLTSAELELLARWIDQGARDDLGSGTSIEWSGLSPAWQPAFAVSVSPEGQYLACSRANAVDLYHLPGRSLIARLEDPHLGGSVAHRDAVQALGFSPDGNLVASASFREVKIWRRPFSQPPAFTGAQRRNWTALASTPTRHRKAIGTAEGTVLIIDAARGAFAAHNTGTAAVTRLALTTDGQRLLVLTADHNLTVLATDPIARLAVVKLEGEPEPHAVAWFNHDRQIVAAVRGENRIRRWRTPIEPGKPLESLAAIEGFEAPVVSLVSGRLADDRLLIGLTNGRVRLQTTVPGSEPIVFDHGSPISTILLSEDGSRAATAGVDGRVKVWTLTDGPACIADLKGDVRLDYAATVAEQTLALVRVEITNHTQSVASVGEKAAKALETLSKAREKHAAQVKALEERLTQIEAERSTLAAAQVAKEEDKIAASIKAVETLAGGLPKLEIARTTSEADVELAQRSQAALESALQGHRTALAAAQAREPVAAEAFEAAQRKIQLAATSPIRALSFASDLESIAIETADQRLVVWDIAKARELASWPLAESSLSAPWFEEGFLRVELPSGTFKADLDPAWVLERSLGDGVNPALLVDRVNAMAFSPDGLTLATGGGEPSRSGELKLWSVKDGSLRMDLGAVHSDTVLALEFSPDGSQLLTGGADRFARLIDVATGRVLRRFEGHNHHVLGVSWRRDGRIIATAGADASVKLWDPATGERLKTLEGFGKETVAVHALGVQDRFLAISGTGQAKVFNSGGETIKTLDAASTFLHALAVTLDGRYAVASDARGVARLWSLEDGKAIAELRKD